MYYTGGLPYAPHMYEIKMFTIPSSNNLTMFLPSDTRRVFFTIQQKSGLPVAFVISAGGNQATKYSLDVGAGLETIVDWYNYYTLPTLEWYWDANGVGNNFVITEILFNQLTEREVNNAIRKPESLASKIKRHFQNSGWGIRRK